MGGVHLFVDLSTRLDIRNVLKFTNACSNPQMNVKQSSIFDIKECLFF